MRTSPDERTGRQTWIVLGVVLSLLSIGSFVLLESIKVVAATVVLEWTSGLHRDGSISVERWEAMIDGMSPQFNGAFQVGTLIPVAFMVLALVSFFMVWKGRERHHTVHSTQHT